MRFFCNANGTPITKEKGICLHNKCFGLYRHDLTKFPNCCPQSCHIFQDNKLGEKELFYGVYKYNSCKFLDMFKIILDMYNFINSYSSIDCKKTIRLHKSEEPLHIWAKIGNWIWLENYLTQLKIIETYNIDINNSLNELIFTFHSLKEKLECNNFELVIEITCKITIKLYLI